MRPIRSFLIVLLFAPLAHCAEVDTPRGDQMIAAYFEGETARLRDACLADVESLDQWKAQRETRREELLEMLGLDPLPARTDLKAVVTGHAENDDIVVENVHFQSRPGLYVTGNLYRPKQLDAPAPAILYVCGHGGVKKDGVSYGNKAHYQHHGAWFAQHGYVCLTIDSLQLGEIEATHHGTYRYKMWWWNNRGYTPAGVEAWNCVRALDYLQSRAEVDPERLGVTGRSGGGVYSWWIAAIDERIKAAVPVAGITDLQNYVVDGAVEGHCDCMFMVNTYRWDYPQIAAMVAPRPLMISNSDQDNIFPLDGVVRTNTAVRSIYELYGAGGDLGLNITPGPHKDTQDLRVPAFRWFNKYLRGEEGLIEGKAEPLFEIEQLRVFNELPEDEQNTTIHETFVPKAPTPEVPATPEAWAAMRDGWRTALQEKVFRGWPEEAPPLDVEHVMTAEQNKIRFDAYEFTSQENIRLRFYTYHRVSPTPPKSVYLKVVDQASWNDEAALLRWGFGPRIEDDLASTPAEFYESDGPFGLPDSMAIVFAPRGVGPTAWDTSEKKQTQIRRRFMLLGQTLDGMRIWDTRRAMQAVRAIDGLDDLPLHITANRQAGAIALYASLFEPPVAHLNLNELPKAHRQGPVLLNVCRYLDLPQAVAMAGERSLVFLWDDEPSGWEFPTAVAERLQWSDGPGLRRVQVKKPRGAK